MIPRALTVEDICNKLRPLYKDKIDKIYFRYSIAESKEEKEDILHFLSTLYQKNLLQLLDKNVLLEPPSEELMDGNYNLALISYANKQLYPFKLREKDFPRHICITGMSGSGKTTLAFNIVEALRKNKKPFLIFDWKKSFRPLIKEDTSAMLFTVGDEKVTNNFKTNINQPPKNVSPKEWINVLSDLLTECFAASFGVHKVILETLDEAFKEWGIYNGSDNYPTWNHIKWRLEEKFEKHQGREAGWIESALRIATVLTFGDFGKVVNYKGENAISVEELLDKRVILELNSLGGVEKTFFSDFVLTYIYKLKKARQNAANHSFDHAIIVDEAHNIFLKKPSTFSNETVTDMIYREMREYGTSLICLDQHVSKISDTVKGNSACHIAFQQQLPADINDISELMLLREQKNYFSQLPVGNAIVKLSERYTSPFLIEVPYATIRNFEVSDEELISRIKAINLNRDFEREVDKDFNRQIVDIRPLEKEVEEIKKEEISDINKNTQEVLYSFVLEQLNKGIVLEDIEKILEESKYQGGYTSNDIIKVINKIFENGPIVNLKNDKNNSIPAPKDSKIGLESDKEKFVRFLIENPTHKLSTVELYKTINLSNRKGNEIKKELESLGRLRIQEEKYEKGWKKFIRLVK
jgi:tRNA uridine 5-carbamoylmethylation protein Kti12